MIGIFDSGLGGLAVTKEVLRQLPEYSVMYLGDTARLPYGNRSQEQLYQYTVEGVRFLFERGCSLVVVACNTASAEALRRLQQEWLPARYPDRRVLGVIRPLVEEASALSKTGRIGVIGTRSTINSEAYIRELKTLRPNVKVTQQAAPLLVPLIEEGWQKRPETMRILRWYLRPLKAAQIDTLILGCTHYPMLLGQIRQVCGKRVSVPDPADVIAQKLKEYLGRHPDIERRLTKNAAHQFFVTAVSEQFSRQAQVWLGRELQLETATLGS